MGTKEMRFGWRLLDSILVRVLEGRRIVILWPRSASLLARWMNDVMWPTANQGYITMWREVAEVEGSAMASKVWES
ncbi:hypothetical protein LINPERPRIM_LOCUS34116 [Linum perenne]